MSVSAGDLESGFTRFPNMLAPAFSHDKQLMYLSVLNDAFTPMLLAVNPSFLYVVYRRSPRDPSDASRTCVSLDDSSASPAVGPDGDVYYGMLGAFSPLIGDIRRSGWMLHYTRELELSSGYHGGFGWDDTPSFVHPSSLQNYTGSSPYLLFIKFNRYINIDGGQGDHRLAILDPFDFELDRVGTNTRVMKTVQSILSPTPQPVNGFPNARSEWCCNIGAFDPFSHSVYCNNEDSHHYRWDLKQNVLAERVPMSLNALLEAYTPTIIGPDGAVYAINMGVMVAFDCVDVGVTTTVPPTTTLSPTACETLTIVLGSNTFQPDRNFVRAGDTLRFVWSNGFHYVVETTSNVDVNSCDEANARFVSPASSQTGFEYSVSTAGYAPGVYRFACPIHCSTMKGTFEVTVKSKQKKKLLSYSEKNAGVLWV
jgi:plastocyanin